MKLTPLHDRIIVEAAPKEERTASGIILPDTAQEKPQRGKVLAVGPGKLLDSGKLAPVDVKTGDVVLYGKYSGTEVTVGGRDYVILRAEDVLAIVAGESAKTAPAKKAVKKVAAAKRAPAPKKVAGAKKTARGGRKAVAGARR